MVRMELPVATRAFVLGMRLFSRRYFAPRKDWVRPALMLASPRAGGQVAVAAAGGVAALALAAGLGDLGAPFRPGDQVGGGGEDGHVDADLGDDVLGGDDPGAGHGVELVDLVPVRLGQLLDPGGQLADLGGVVVDGGEHHRQDGGVLVGEEGAVQGLFQLADLAAHDAAGQLGQTCGLRSPAMIACSMARPETPWMSEITLDSFRCASSSSFSTRCFSAVRAWVRCGGSGCGCAAGGCLRGHEAGGQAAPLGDLR